MRNKIISLSISFLLLINPGALVVYGAAPKSVSNQQIELGNKYAKAGHDAYSIKSYLKSAQNYEKAYQTTKAKVYLDNAVVAYTSLAYDLTSQKKYEEALKYCNKVLSLRSNDINTKELLSEIYFSRGADYFYTGELAKAKVDLETSLKYCVTQDQTERAKDGLAKVTDALQNNQTVVPKYQDASDTSVPETLSKLESKIYGTVNNSAPIIDRVNKLEKEVLGKTYESDGLIIRVDRLKRTILPEYASQPVQDQAYDGTYIKEIMDQSMGKVTIFGEMPIKVYIDENDVKPYKKFYRDAAIEGFKEWEKASENRIKFEFVNNPAMADINVVWSGDAEDFPWQPTLKKEDISAEKDRIKYRKASTAVQIGSILAMVAGGLAGVPVIGSVGALGNGVASPILQYKGTNTEKRYPDLKIYTKITEGMTDEAAKAKIKQIAVHQMGHAIGIYGHSPDPNDIMYSNFAVNQLSERDINTIRYIYKSNEAKK